MSTGEIGNIVLGRSDAGPVAAVLVESRAGRFGVITAAGSRESWTASKVFFHTGFRVSATAVQPAAAAVASFVQRVLVMVESADLGGAWELLVDRPAVGSDELADLLFSRDGPEEQSAAAWAVETDSIYFKQLSDGRYVPASRAAVTSQLRARAANFREAEALRKVHLAILAALDSNEAAPMSDRDVATGVGWLSSLLYDGPDGRDGKRGLALLQSLRGAVPSEPGMAAFETLVRLKVCDPDEIVSIRANRIDASFEPVVEMDAARIAASVTSCSCPDTYLWAQGTGPVAIDDESTRDVDDALMVMPVEGGFEVHVLIADPGSFVTLDSHVGRSGLARASSLYAPTGTFPMLPRTLSEGALSLSVDGGRPMLDFSVLMGADGSVTDFRIVQAFGRIESRMTYDSADAILTGNGVESDGRLKTLAMLAEVLRARRVEAGAVMLEKDEYHVKVIDGVVSVRRIPYASPSRRLVAEFMILACSLAGRFARNNGIPVVYRRQDPPERDAAERLKGMQPGSRAWYYNMLRTLKRGELSTVPGYHHSLGVAGYTQVTSPLRRFQDLLAHVQIKGFLSDGCWPIDADRLMNMFAELESRVEIVTRVERESRRYWTLKYLQGFCGRQVDGEVVARIGGRVLVELDDTGLVLPVSAGAAQPGARLRLVVRDVDPRRDSATLTPA